MAKVVVMPKLGLTMTEGTVSKWLKKVGDAVSEGEPLFEVETDTLSGRHAGSAYERAPRRNHRHRILRRLYGDRIAGHPDRIPARR